MYKLSIQPLVLIVLFIFSIIVMPCIVEAKAKPTEAEVKFAREFYRIFRGIEDQDKLMEHELDTCNIAEPTPKDLKPFLINKYENIYKAYKELDTLKPEECFAHSYELLINTVFTEISFLKATIEMCDTETDMEILDKEYKRYSTIRDNYDQAKELFTNIIEKWPDKQKKRVEKAYSPLDLKNLIK